MVWQGAHAHGGSEADMAETNAPRRRRAGSHFAAPGTSAHFSWDSEDSGDDAYGEPREAYGRHDAAGAASYATSSIPSIDDDGAEASPYDARAPRAVPVGSDSSFDTISAGHGAVVTTRDTAAEAAGAARDSYLEQGRGSKRLSGRNRPEVRHSSSQGPGAGRIAVIVILIALVLVGLVFVFRGLFSGTQDERPATTELVSETQVATDDAFDYGGYSYSLATQDDGTVALVRTSDGGSPTVLMQLSGTPVALIFANGVFYVPENLSSGWDVMCYTIGDGSIPTQYADSDGNPVGGTSQLASATYDSGVITCMDVDGQTTTLQVS
jgi:hypothetical protein